MTTSTTFDPNDPRLTAYALGELHGDELAEFEQLLAESSAARDAFAEIRETTGWLRSELAAEPVFTLSADQHQRLEQHFVLGTGAVASVCFAQASCSADGLRERIGGSR